MNTLPKFKVFIYDNQKTYIDTVIAAANQAEAEAQARRLMVSVPVSNALITVTPIDEFNTANKW